ncbi:MAG: hypothetical protein JSU04_09495 [Bdellovibrionales bacterium]|nr:hypothetical protein [Bdellovibrionales bacterium]
MRIFFGVLIFLFSYSALASEPHLRNFVTDYCTMFPEGTPQKPDLWKHCCFEHDLRYWFGGDSADLDFADESLRQCVKDVAGNFWANLMYKGVREGHSSPVKNQYHWSWGWDPERMDSPLSEAEKTLIRKDLGNLGLDPAYVHDFIGKYHLN